jgi:hypothetical protein
MLFDAGLPLTHVIKLSLSNLLATSVIETVEIIQYGSLKASRGSKRSMRVRASKVILLPQKDTVPTISRRHKRQHKCYQERLVVHHLD